MELYSDLVLAVIYFKFNIHTEYTLFLISQTQAISSLVVTNKILPQLFCMYAICMMKIVDFG